MKKNYLLSLATAIIMVLGLQQSMAQVAVGPRVGINIATLVGEDVDSEATNSNVGVLFGASFVFGDRFCFQPEILYSPQGASTDQSFLGNTVTYNFNMNYLQVPLLLRYNILNDNVKVYVNAGPGLGFWLSAKTVAKDDGDESSEKYEFDSDIDNRIDIPIIVGAGAAFKVGPGQLFVDVRYLQGLLGIQKKPDGVDDFNHTRNSVVMIGAGYLIVFGGDQ